jgi:ribonuclease Z
MNFEFIILGSSSGRPTADLYQSAYVLNIHNNYILLDCGEGAQMQLFKYGIPIMKINHILITHLHADHFIGLIGLLNTYNLLKRDKPIHIYAPKGLEEIIQVQFKHAGKVASYPIYFHELNMNQNTKVIETPTLEVYSFPVNHRIECNGFLFREKAHLRNINPELVSELKHLPNEVYQILKRSKDYEFENRIYEYEKYTLPPPKSRTFAFVTDTLKDNLYIKHIQGVDMLFHEATFTDEHEELTTETFHSTARQAAEIGQEAQVKKLIIGHFSTRYKDFETHLKEAREIFPNTFLAEQGKRFEIQTAQV